MKSLHPSLVRQRLRAGFTLIELLTVIAIIAILAAILVPTVSVAMKHVKSAKTLVQLNNLVQMTTMYKDQYKVWPIFSTGATSATDTVFSLKANAPRFVNIMSGNPSNSDLQYNHLKVPFATFNDADLSTDPTSVTPVDAFGNDDLYLVYNTNLSTPHQIQPLIVNQIAMSLPGSDRTVSIHQNENNPINADCVGLSPGAGFSDSDAVTTWTVIAPGSQ